MVEKLRTDLSANSVLTGEKEQVKRQKNEFQKKGKIPSYVSTKKESNSKSGLKTLGIQKYQSLPPHVPPFPPGFK